MQLPHVLNVQRTARRRNAAHEGNPPVERPAGVPGVPAVLLALACALALLLSGDGGVAQAQSVQEVVLVSNTGQIPWNAAYQVGNASGLLATQGFHTGDNPGGYTLSTVGIGLLANQFSGEETLTLHIYSSNSDGTANALLYTFSPPATPGSAISTPGIVDFTAPVGSTLDPDTDYHVVIQGSGDDGDDATLGLTGSNEETGSPNWTIENFSRHDGARNVARNSFRIHIKGTINPVPRVLVSNVGNASANSVLLGTSFDAAQSFTTGGNPAGYTQAGIDLALVTQDGTDAPTVTLHSGSATGAKVADFDGPSALTANTAANYTFTPTTAVTLDASTEYWVVVEGGSADMGWTKANSSDEDADPAAGWSISDAASTRSATSTGNFTATADPMTFRVNGFIRNSAAAGMPAITAPNVFRVPAVLTADLSGITDGNGIEDIADSATYNWQRFASGGITLEADVIGTDATYALTAADVGKTLKVQVSFTDGDGYSEGPLTSAATQAITAAATDCNPPTYAGGATQLGPARKVTVGRGILDEASTEFAYGYDEAPALGSLDNTTFTTAAANEYVIKEVLYSAPIDTHSIALDTLLAAADQRTLVLHVCDQAYLFDSATKVGFQYLWGSSDQDWSTYAERTVYISQDTTAPTAESVAVNGTEIVITFSEDLGEAASLLSSTFTGKKTPMGGSETALTFTSDAPEIEGNTLTLASASSVVATDGDVKVTYTKPMSGSANKLVDLFGNETASFADQEVGNLLADMEPPTLATPTPAVADAGLTLTLTFSEPLKDTSVPDKSAFTVKRTPAGGGQETVDLAANNAVAVAGSAVTLKLDTPIAHNDTAVKVSYEKPTSGSVIEDVLSNDLATFPDQAVTNNSTIPQVSVEAVYPDASSLIALPVLRITRSNIGTDNLAVSLDVTQTDDYVDSSQEVITIVADNTTSEKTNTLDYPGNTSGNLTYTLAPSQDYAPAISPGNVATVQIKAPASGVPITVRHAQASWTVDEGDTVSAMVTFTLTPGLAAPRDDLRIFLIAESEGAEPPDDYVDFPEEGAASYVDAEPGGWTAAAGGGMTQTSAITTVETIEDTEVEANEVFYLDFTQDNNQRALDIPLDEVSVPNLRTTVSILDDDPLVVTNVQVTSSPTEGYYGVGDTIEFTVTFNAYMTLEEGPLLEFELGGATRQAEGQETEDEMGVTFEYTVETGNSDDHDGISWGADTLSFNGGSIFVSSKGALIPRHPDLVNAAQAALSAHKVDTTKPSLVEAEVDGTTLTLTFSEDLNNTAPANTAFTVKVDGGSGTNPTAVSIAGRVMTLRLGAAVTSGQTVTVSYAKPGTNNIKDLSGKEADAFTDRTVDFATAIVNLRAAPGNRRVTLSWDDPNDGTIVRYQYRYMNTSDDGWNPDWRNISGSGTGTTSYTATSLTNGIEYTFQVHPVYSQGGQNVPGKEGEVKSVPRGPLAPPRSLIAASAGDVDLVLTWADPSDITITGYQYRHRNTSDSGWNPGWTDIPGSGASTTSHTLSGLTNNLLYTVEVRAIRNGAGGPSAHVTGTPGSSGGGGGGGGTPPPTGPSFTDGASTSRSVAVPAPSGADVGDPVVASHPANLDITYFLIASVPVLFTVDEMTGQIRLVQGVSPVSGQTYRVTVKATDSTSMEAYIDVVIAVEPHQYDLDRNGTFEKEEVIEAINDYLFGTGDEQITKEQVLEIINLYLFG